MSERSDLEAGMMLKRACMAMCKSGKFETGQGTCALVCLDQLGSARSRPCAHVVEVHAKFAATILAAALGGKK